MSIDQISSGGAGINALLNGQSNGVAEKEDPLGRDAFLTMLVAQLKHQDPLNPMEGAEFSAQLAQFSTLEQMFKVNDNLDAIETALGPDTDQNLLDFIGKEVTCENSSLHLEKGQSTGGDYTIGEKANILINIYDGMGVKVATMIGGQKEAGTHTVEWNGTDDNGEMMADGSYSYEVLAVDESYGQVSVETALSGMITGVTYENGSAYLLMGDRLVDPATVTKVNQGGVGA